jgi:glycosyltransferase involved in cell wall biosynthesis
MRICALIPVYNNIDTISGVVERCRAVLEPDVFVVCDGSTDGSGDAAERAGARVIRIESNTGKGNAIHTGLNHALELGYTHGVVVDADGQHLPEEIPRLIDAAAEVPDSIWVGVRRMDDREIPVSSRRGRSISNFWATVNGWQRCMDTQCGFRVYPIEETLALNCKEKGFTYEMEVLVRASWAGMKIGHTYVNVIYPDGENRVTHFDMKKDNLAFTWLSFRMFLGMLGRSPVLLYKKLS